MKKKNLQYPAICPHCGHNNNNEKAKNKWCHETISDQGYHYGWCNRQAPPADGWEDTGEKNRDGISKYIYREVIPPKERISSKRKTFYTYKHPVTKKDLVRVKRVDMPNAQKQIFQENFIQGRGWEAGGLDYEKVPLYRADSIAKAIKEGKSIAITEGEKVADFVFGQFGLETTTNIGGSKKWLSHHTEFLKDAKLIYLCPDRDIVGIEHMEFIAKELTAKGVKIKWIYAYPTSPLWRLNTPTKGGLDLYDYIRNENVSYERLIREASSTSLHDLDQFEKKVDSQNISFVDLINDIRDRIQKSGTLSRGDIAYLAKKARLSSRDVESIYLEESASKAIEDNIDKNELKEFLEYQTKKIKVDDYISDPNVAEQFKIWSNAKRLDDTFLLNTLLPLLSGCLGSRIALQVKAGWVEYPTFWTVVVAPPSMGKSIVHKEVFSFLFKKDRMAEKKYYKNLEALRTVEFNWNNLPPQDKKQNMDNPEINPELYEKEFCHAPNIHCFQNGSIEGILKRVSEQPKRAGIVWTQDEINTIFGNLDKYNKGDTMPLLLSVWSSHCNYNNFQRSERGNAFSLGEQTIPITGGIQPQKFGKLFNLIEDPDGFCTRWLFTKPTLHSKFATPSEGCKPIQGIIEGIADKLTAIPNDDLFVTFSSEAQLLWYEVERHFSEQQIKGYRNKDDSFAGYMGKMKSQTARLALIVHLLDYAFGNVSDIKVCTKSALERGLKLANFFVGQYHSLRVHQLSDKSNFWEDLNLSPLILEILNFVEIQGEKITETRSQITISKILRKFNGRKINGARLNTAMIEELLRPVVDLGFGLIDQKERTFAYEPPSDEITIAEDCSYDETEIYSTKVLEPPFQVDDNVVVVNNEKDKNYIGSVVDCSPLEVTVLNMNGNLDVIPCESCDLLVDEVDEAVADVMSLLANAKSKQEVLSASKKHSRYFWVAYNTLTPEMQKQIEQYLN